MSIIGNGSLFPGPGEAFIENGAVYYVNDTIVAGGPTDELKQKYPEAKFIDAQGGLIMPGLICGHSHYYGMFSRGMALKDEAPSNFLEILERLWWRLDKALTENDNYLSAAVCLDAAIRFGCTTVIDHHASPNQIAGSLDTIAKAHTDFGVRGCLCYEVTDRNGLEGAQEGIDENIRFLKKVYADEPNPLLGASFGLHAAFTCSDDTLKKSVAAVNALPEAARKKAGFHIHVCEGAADNEDSEKKYNKTTVERLRDLGILGPNSIAGHCVFVNEKDMDILKETGTMVVHNPESNMNNGVGIPPVCKLLEKGIPVGLGTDGITYDMIQESKTNYFVHKLVNHDPRKMGGESLDMLMKYNAQFASKFFSKPVGYLKPDHFADVIIMRYDPPTALSEGNLPWHMIFGMSGAMVESVFIAGRCVLENGKHLTMDTKDIARRARAAAPGVWDRL
eukprot:GCRY01001150.1.p1 GENE.GCRY01001150.1~~GCRY01001150.1.p1  ORF type:complete len:449 (-),score=120.51 GCRY01001150.1:50-1396(-)